MAERDVVPTHPEGGGLWSRVVGQPAAVEVLRAAVAADEVAHAWLLVGPSGVGQAEVVAALAADLNCPASPAATACGACSTCRRIEAGTHPAYLAMLPEGTEHVVGSVRDEWIAVASRSLAEGRVRVLRIVEADRMNEAAQNAFLKILEEPPPGLVWVLESEDPTNLLETVVSRTRRVDLTSWTPADLAAAAARHGVADEIVAPLVRASMGSPHRLAELARTEVWEARARHLAIPSRLVEEGPGAAVPIAKELAEWAKSRVDAAKSDLEEEVERLDEAYAGEWPPGVRTRLGKRHERMQREARRQALRSGLDDLASYLRDIVALHAGAEPVNLDHTAALGRDARDIPADVALEGLAAVAECADAIERQGQPELHLERLLLRLGVAIYNARASA